MYRAKIIFITLIYKWIFLTKIKFKFNPFKAKFKVKIKVWEETIKVKIIVF
jgi:hypothetical protein